MKFLRKYNRKNDFPTIFAKVIAKNLALENNIRFHNKFFHFRGVPPPPPLQGAYAIVKACSNYWGIHTSVPHSADRYVYNTTNKNNYSFNSRNLSSCGICMVIPQKLKVFKLSCSAMRNEYDKYRLQKIFGDQGPAWAGL